MTAAGADAQFPAPVQRVTVPSEHWGDELRRLRDAGFRVFDWLGAIDESGRADGPGIDIVCSLIAPRREGERMRRALATTTVSPGRSLPSLTGVWAGAAWYEREAYEMTGLDVSGFDDGTGLGLRRLLLPPDVDTPPLRSGVLLEPRVATPWPGSADDGSGARRRSLPPGVPSHVQDGS